MSVGNVGNVLATEYQYADNSRKTEAATGFDNAVQKATESQQAAKRVNSRWAGDMVVPQPPDYRGFTYDSTISNKSKEEMTMEEYKQWFMNEMSQIPVSTWVRTTFTSGALVIKEEAFERMKNDPEYEKYVLNRIRSMYSVSSLPVGPGHVCYEVIGASQEECYGYAGPVGSNGTNAIGNGKSWWDKRRERYEELLEEQMKAAQKRAQENRELAQQAYMSRQLASQQRLQSFFMEREQGVRDAANMTAFQMPGISGLAAAAYEGTIRSYSESIMRNDKI